jgi:hypothetical protein
MRQNAVRRIVFPHLPAGFGTDGQEAKDRMPNQTGLETRRFRYQSQGTLRSCPSKTTIFQRTGTGRKPQAEAGIKREKLKGLVSVLN